MHSPSVFMLGLFIILCCIQSTLPNIIVSPDGSGDYITISEAIMAVPSYMESRFYIHIRAGTYEEIVFIGPEKKNIVLMGEGINKTLITGNKSSASGLRTTDTAIVSIYGNGFVAQDISFENVAGPHMNQAVALVSQADYLAFYRCSFRGFQDTLYTKKGYQFFRECEITGTIDFIFGSAKAIFQTCLIYVGRPLSGQSNTITAQKREYDFEADSGIVIMNSTIIATQDLRQQLPRAKTYLGRPWGNHSRTIIMESFLDDIIEPEGWLEWEHRGTDKVDYAEYRNFGPGANTTSRVRWSKVINDPTEAATFTVRNFIQGDKWIPPNIPFYPDLRPQHQFMIFSGAKTRLAVERLMATTVLFASVIIFLF